MNIYFDNNATTSVALEVLEAMLPYLKEAYGNPSTAYSFGRKVRDSVERARGQVASLIGAKEEEIIFTSSGTESDNTAIMSALRFKNAGKHIVTTAVEHPAVLNLCKYLQTFGYTYTELPVDNAGMIDLDYMAQIIDANTAILSIMYANNETGVIFPIDKISRIASSKNVVLHTDAVQAVGKLPINVNDLGVQMLSISGHKLHAPKGVGALYVKKGTEFYPYIIGGHQENGRRAGTENVAAIVGLGKACDIAKTFLDSETLKVQHLRDRLEAGLLNKCSNTIVNGASSPRLSNTSNISFAYVDGEAILMMLDKEGIYASSGSACSSGSGQPSHVLRAMNIPQEYIRSSVRFSLSPYNSEEEVDALIGILPQLIERLRHISFLRGN